MTFKVAASSSLAQLTALQKTGEEKPIEIKAKLIIYLTWRCESVCGSLNYS